jgi:hypothetical protein
MRILFFAAILASGVASSAMAQDFNPGTVIGNVYQNPASGCGYGYGFDCYPPGYGHNGTVHAHRSARGRRRVRTVGATDPDAQR